MSSKRTSSDALGAVFDLQGSRFHLDDEFIKAGQSLWHGLVAERGEEGAKSVLLDRLTAAARVLNLSPEAVPDMEQIISTPPAGEVLLTSMAALLACGQVSYPDT